MFSKTFIKQMWVFYNLQNKQKSEENEQFTKNLKEAKSHTMLAYIYLFLIDQIKESTLIEKVKQSKASLGVGKRTGLNGTAFKTVEKSL